MTRKHWTDDKGHVWKLDEDGEIDWLCFEWEEDFLSGHNGPKCTKCGYGFCHHCLPDGPDEECEFVIKE